MHALLHMRKSEDSFAELVLLYLSLGSRDQTQVIGLAWPVLCPLNHLASSCWKLCWLCPLEFYGWYLQSQVWTRGLTIVLTLGAWGPWLIVPLQSIFQSFLICVWRQGLTMYLWLASNLLYKPGWPPMLPPASASRVLRLKTWIPHKTDCSACFL